MPSAVVTFQYSPLLSPLVAPVSFSTLEASSFSSRQVPEVSSRTSVEDLPFSEMVALWPARHCSPESFWPSLEQGLKVRSTKPGV